MRIFRYVCVFIWVLGLISMAFWSEPVSGEDGTASPPDLKTTQNVFIPSSAPPANTLVIETTTSSVPRALDSLGVAYDYMSTSDFTTIDFSPYSTILIGMDGGSIDSTSVEAVANATASGKKLIMLGGTSLTSYGVGMQNYLLQHNGTIDWVISSSPHLTVTVPGHPLALDLPSPHDYVASDASYYMLRITDPAATVVAVNGDGFPALVSKPIGDGNLIYSISSPRQDHLANEPDFQVFKTIIRNALNFVNPDIEVSPTSFTFSVEEGGSDNDLLVVSNVRQDTLNWSISDRDATLLLNDGQKLSVDLRSVNLQQNYSKGVESNSASFNKASSKNGTASYGGVETARNVFKPSSTYLASTLVIGTTDIGYSVLRAMDSLGVAYDYMFTTDFDTVDFSPYSTILIGMDGGLIDSTSVEAVANATPYGKKLIMLGGTNYIPYYAGMQTYLLQHNGNTGWVISSSPHLTVTAPGHPLTMDLPSPYDYADSSAAFYMLRITDPAATVVAVNGDGFPALVTKSIAEGTLIYSVSSVYAGYYSNDPDFQVLKTIIRNALNYGQCPWLTENVLSGSIPPGGFQNVGIFVDASGLTAGTYDGNLLIASNDPDEPLVTVPVHLTVTPSVGIKDNEGKIPTTYDISPNYPNPFNPTTTIKYQVPQTEVVQISIYNLLGQSVRTLLNNKTEPGYYEVKWNGLDDAGNQVASGIYVYRIQAGDFMKSRKMILLK